MCLPFSHCDRPLQEVQACQDLIADYMKAGAINELSSMELQHGAVRYLVPWRVNSKLEGENPKHRLISDCRLLNAYLDPPHFKLDHWGQIFPFVCKGMWAAKLDLKHAYFHLPLAEGMKPYLCFNLSFRLFQAACFRLSTLPQLVMSVMKVYQKLWRGRFILCFIYLDDILVLGQTPAAISASMSFILESLASLGMTVNSQKSILVLPNSWNI